MISANPADWQEPDDWKALAWEKLAQARKDERLKTIEACARFLQEEYPDNVNTNAFCAAIRSLAVSSNK